MWRLKKRATALEIISITGKLRLLKIRQSSELMSLLDELNKFKNTLKNVWKALMLTEYIDRSNSADKQILVSNKRKRLLSEAVFYFKTLSC